MAKKKRNYEEVTNGVQKKKKLPPVPEKQSGLAEGRSNESDLHQSRGHLCIESSECSSTGELYQSDSGEIGWTTQSDLLRYLGQRGHGS